MQNKKFRFRFRFRPLLRSEWLLLAVLAVAYLSVLLFLLLKIIQIPTTDRRTVDAFVVLLTWALAGWVVPALCWLFAQRHLYRCRKESAVVAAVTVKTEVDGAEEIPVVVFSLPQSGQTVEIHRPVKYYHYLRRGDAGTLVYREKNGKIFVTNFIRDGV